MLPRLRSAPIVGFLSNLKGKVRFPEKFKGTLLEKWATYWKNLVIDYRQMLQDLRQDMQDEPRKALKWTAGIATLCGLAKNNPSELDFTDNLRRINNEIVLVSDECVNPKSISHLRFLLQCYNEGVIHYRSFGIVSFMYATELNDSCDLYKANCTYLKPKYLSLPTTVLDVGFMGKWWNIYIKTTNYDINNSQVM